MEKFYLTTPIYYASGKPHIGHAFATIYADVIARHQKSLGRDVFFLTGTDEHGSKIAEKAAAEGKTPKKFVDEIADYYQKTWQALNVKYDEFIRTTSEKHIKGVEEFIKKIHEAGDIYEGFYEGLYCVDCERFYTEKELVEGLCPDHLKPPQKVREKNYFFNLRKEYWRRIYDMFVSAPNDIQIIPDKRRLEIIKMLEADISDFSITREKVKWGIPYPYDRNQTIYVWVEALMNYATALDFPNGEKFQKYWPPDLQIIGAEISKFHSIFWPALLMSMAKTTKLQYLLPRKIFIHGLFTVDGQKMSKTVGNIIDPRVMIEQFGSDATRYLLLSQFPATEHGDVKAGNFAGKYNSDLANGIGNLAERVFTLILNGNIAIKEKYIDRNFRAETEKIESEYNKQFENYNLFEALKVIFLFVKQLDKEINEQKPWADDLLSRAEKELFLINLFFGIEKIFFWLRPFMPQRMKEALEYMEKIKSGKVNQGDKLNLFPRLKN